jgi:hypothetical protein
MLDLNKETDELIKALEKATGMRFNLCDDSKFELTRFLMELLSRHKEALAEY